jgi:hypothetical protein
VTFCSRARRLDFFAFCILKKLKEIKSKKAQAGRVVIRSFTLVASNYFNFLKLILERKGEQVVELAAVEEGVGAG